jgi:glycosyltransferase involved in cell wall biosynthesis
MNSLVSVVIPCYNVERYVSECLASVLAQSYPQVEIICVDNMSGDNTLGILKQQEQQHPGVIKVVQETTKGAPAARNKGLSMASGEWIQFLDADDLLDPDKIECQMKMAADADLIVAPYRVLQLNGNSRDSWFTEDIWEGLNLSRLGITSSNLFRREKVLEAEGWNPALKSSQEYDLMFRMLKKKARVVFDRVSRTVIRERESGSISKLDLKGNAIRLLELRIEIRNYQSEELKYSAAELEPINQAIFDQLRVISNHELKLALELYPRHMSASFRPKKNPVNGRAYVYLFRLLGFKRLEKLRHFIKKRIQ